MQMVGSLRHLQIASKLFFFNNLCNGGATVILSELRRRKLKKDDVLCLLGSVDAERILIWWNCILVHGSFCVCGGVVGDDDDG